VGESFAPILKSPLDFSAERVVRTDGGVFIGGGALNVNCFGVGVSIGDCGDVPNALASLFADDGVSTRNALALFLNEALFLLPLVEPAPTANVLGGVNRASSLASEPFGESTAMGSGDVTASDDRVLSALASRSSAASNDLAARGASASSRARFRSLALRARDPGLFAGIARSSNVFTGLSRPPTVSSRASFSANVPQLDPSSRARSRACARASAGFAAPFARARKLRPRAARSRPPPAPR
jgi:hypothetical protein